MVLLRLAVIVPPPDAVGGRNPNDKPTTFMLPVHNPEDITLAQLAARITAQWEKLCPEHPPLSIKKLLDHDHDFVDLDMEMSVADVFVDMGKARADGLDQRATIRVIQYPTLKPIRYQSVTQDWNAAAEHYASVMPPARPPVPLFDERPRSLSGPAVNNLGPTGLGHVRRSIENGRDLDFASVRTSRERKQSIEDSTTRRGDYVMEGTEDDIRNFELTTPIRHNGRPANPSKESAPNTQTLNQNASTTNDASPKPSKLSSKRSRLSVSDTLVVDIGDDPSPPAKRARPQTTFDWPSNESIANYDWGTDYEPSVRMVSNQKAAPSPPPAQTISAFKEPVEVVDLSKDDVVEVLGSPPSNQAQKTPHRIPIRQTKSPADEEDQVVNTTVREPVASPPPENDIEAIQLSPATSVEVEKGAVAFCNGLAEVYDLPPTPPNKIQRRAILRRGSTHLNKFARPVLEPSNESVQEVPGTPTPQKERETAPVESASTANDAEDIAVEQPNDTQNASASIQPQVPVTTTESVPRPQETAEPPSSHKEKKSKKSFKRNRRRKEMNIPEWLTKGWRELFYRQRALEKKYEKAVEEGRSVDEIEARREIVNIFLELFEAKWKKSKFLDIHYEQYTDARRQIKEHYGDIQVPTIESDEVAKLIADHVALNGRPSPSLSSDPDINSTTPEPCEVTQTQRSSVETSMQTQNELIAAVSKNAGAESSYSSLPMLLQDNAAGTATQPSSATRELSIELTTESGVPEATTSRSDRVPATKTTTAATSTTRQGVNSTPTDAGLGSGQGASSKAAPVIAKAPANKAHVARKSPYEDIDSDFDLEKFNITSNKKSKKKYSGKASNAAVKEPKSDNQPIPYRGAVSSPVVSADKPSFMSFSQPTPSFSRHPDLSIAKPARPSLKALLDEQNANHNNDGAKGATPKPKGGAADRSNGNGNYRSNGKAREGWTLLDKASSKPRK